jgi:hypothetical protein
VAEATDAPVLTEEERRSRGAAATRGAFFGFFVDMFDIYLPIGGAGSRDRLFPLA